MTVEIYKGRFIPFRKDSIWETSRKGKLDLAASLKIYPLLVRQIPSTFWERTVSFWRDKQAEWIPFTYLDDQERTQEVQVNREHLLNVCLCVDAVALPGLGASAYLSHFIQLKSSLLDHFSQVREIPKEQQLKIIDSWLHNKDAWIKKAQLEGICLIPRRNLVRSLVVTTKGELFILLNRMKKGDKEIGKGGYKHAKLCFELTMGKWAVYTSSEGRENYDKEVAILKKLMGKPHILPLWENFVSWSETGGIYKYCMITEYGNQGTLSYFLQKRTLGAPEKKEICRKLAIAVQIVHNSGYIHSDIKLGNVFVKEKEGKIDLFLADFGLSYEFACVNLHDLEIRGRGTICYLHPTIASCMITGNRSCLKDLPFSAEDIWALGVVFYQVVHATKNIHWRQKNSEATLKLLSEYAPLQGGKEVFAKPKDEKSLEYLIWNMLQADPKKQFSMQQVVEFLSSSFF